tara:strand:- start:380 stop:661 length:282 start_codon:yes stop_codon:yes gene_type:complete
MNIFGIGLPEIAVIGALALIIFGPKRLPELGKSLGKTLKGLQNASNEFEKEVQKAMIEDEDSLNQEDLEQEIKSIDPQVKKEKEPNIQDPPQK